jgi:tetratricopeptide (TPR) repeat protein
VPGPNRIRRQQIIREVEGYLELLELFPEPGAVRPENRERIARRSLQLLDRIEAGDERTQALHLKGLALRSLGRFVEALAPLKEAAELDPQNIHIWLTIGWCQKRAGRIDLAIESLEEALQIDPAEAIIHYNLACYWSLAGNREHALEFLHHALQIDPNYRDLVDGESDFDPIRNDPGFQALTSMIA